jgi:hypothetical protein
VPRCPVQSDSLDSHVRRGWNGCTQPFGESEATGRDADGVTTFLWILFSGLLMSAIALVGSLTLLLSESTLQKILLPLVSFAAGRSLAEPCST